jgi:regulator of replication initiation timing
VAVSRALEHYEMMKSRHLLGMENQRLRARLNEISELATQGTELAPAANEQDDADLEPLWDQEKVYDLVI